VPLVHRVPRDLEEIAVPTALRVKPAKRARMVWMVIQEILDLRE